MIRNLYKLPGGVGNRELINGTFSPTADLF